MSEVKSFKNNDDFILLATVLQRRDNYAYDTTDPNIRVSRSLSTSMRRSMLLNCTAISYDDYDDKRRAIVIGNYDVVSFR